MIWKTSDYAILILSASAASNILMISIILCRSFFEQKLSMKQWNFLLKIAVVYLLLLMPLLSAYVLYESVFHDAVSIIGDDFTQARIIGNRSISGLTQWGNHWLFAGLILAWGIGFLLFYFHRFLIDSDSLKKLEKLSTSDKNVSLSLLKAEISGRLGIKRSVVILRNDIVATPFTIGIINHKIFLPNRTFTEEEAEFILKHELVHCKKKDYVYRKALSLLGTIYWFNPALTYLIDYCVDVNEMACDETVLDKEPKKRRSFYANMMLQMAAEGLLLKQAVCLTGHTENGIERRIIHIMKNKNFAKKPLFAVMFCSMLVICPFTSFAASKSISYMQSAFVEKILFEESEDKTSQVMFTECEEMNENTNIRNLSKELMPKGGNIISVDVSGKEMVVIDTVYLSTGDEVHFAIKGDNTSDKFRAGLMVSSGSKQYVSSSNGKITHGFSINKTGYYDVYVEGTTNSDIHISGGITIFD